MCVHWCVLAGADVTVEGLLGEVLDIHVRVCGQLLQHRLDFCLKGTERKEQAFHFAFWTQKSGRAARTDVQAVEDGADLLEGLGHVEADVGHLVVGHLQDHWQHLLCGDFLPARFRQSLERDRSAT